VAVVLAAGITVLMAYEGKSSYGFHVTDMPWGVARVAYPFLVGILINRVGQRIRMPTLPFFMIGLLLMATFTGLELPIAWESIYDAIVVLLAFPLVLLMARGRAGGPLATTIARGLGAISYPLYAVHYPLSLYCLMAAQRIGASALIGAVMTTVIVVAIAALFAYAFDAPVRRWLQGQLRKIPRL
jgi:peptidoglycan/LPS O-acetylase OafA/YrhL